MKKNLLLCFLLTCTSVLFAQISEGGTPPSFNYPNTLRSAKTPYTVNADINVPDLLYQDSIAEKNGSPMAIAVIVPVTVNIKNNGEWITLPNKQRIWQQKIYLPGANSLILGYNDFYIPEGGKLFIYNKNRSQIIGAYTENTNPAGGRFHNQIIFGDEITLEYVESAVSSEEPRIELEDVGYVYRNMYEEYYNAANNEYTITPGQSASCMINVNCSEGDDWRDQQRGVVFIVSKFALNGKWYGCSGSLINNTKNDATPYVLTASHCFYMYNETTHAPLGVTDFSTAQFYFNYERSTCNNQSEIISTTQSITNGAELLINTGHIFANGSDGLLLKLKTNIPKNWNPYYNGWDISNSKSPSGVVIHHPNHDVKKISTYTKTLVNSDITGWTSMPYYWRVYYSPTTNGHSVSEGGSSGSPLFNDNKLIVGTLSGGASYCTQTSNGGPNSPDYFGNMYYHWDKIAGQEMKSYLDPLNLGVTSFVGYDPNKGVGIESEKDDIASVNLVLFPNPAYEYLNVNANGIIKQITVCDLIGRVIYSDKDLKSSTAELSVLSWPRGIYSVIVDTDNGRYSEKVNIK